MKYTADQVKTLDAIGTALKYQMIDFTAATELRDQIRAGQVREARAALNAITCTYVQVVSSLQIKTYQLTTGTKV